MNTVDTQCAVLVDLFDRVLDTGFLEVRFLLLQGIVEGFFIERVREDPVLGDQTLSSLGITQPFLDSAMLMVAA